jgi:hypothetical protein
MTERQTRFVELYLNGPPGVCYNATRAAEAVGYRWPAKQGPRLRTFPDVSCAIETGFQEQLDQLRKCARPVTRRRKIPPWCM